MRAIAVIVLLLGLGCQESEQVKTDPSLASDVQPIFSASCATSGCHSGAAPAGSYDLSSYGGIMGDGSDTVPNVIAAQADSSLLYQRIIGVVTPQMPLNGTALDAMKEATIRNWINKGAKNN